MRPLLLFVLAMSALTGCESTLHCIGKGDQPRWQQKTLSNGMRFQSYSESVSLQGGTSFSVQEFSVSGQLPQGVDAVFNGMTAQISGTPIAAGDSDFTLKCRIGYYNSEETATTCSTTISRKYRIHID